MGTAAETATDSTAIRPFHIEVPEEQLAELRRRIEATRWPSGELVDDRSQGVQLATMRELARYWTTDYDWRACERDLTRCRSSSLRSTAWTSTSSTCARRTRTRCR